MTFWAADVHKQCGRRVRDSTSRCGEGFLLYGRRSHQRSNLKTVPGTLGSTLYKVSVWASKTRSLLEEERNKI